MVGLRGRTDGVEFFCKNVEMMDGISLRGLKIIVFEEKNVK